MKKISINELKNTIKAAEAARLTKRLPFRPEGPKLEKNRMAVTTMMSRWMRESGLDVDKLEILHEQRESELLRLADKHKQEALRLAARQKKLEAGGQAKVWTEMAARPEISPDLTYSLDKPFLIWSTPMISIDAAAAPNNSWAKFKYLTSAYEGTQKVSFYYSWINPWDLYAVINASSSLAANGYLRAHAPLGFPFVNTSSVSAWAGLRMALGVSRDLESYDYNPSYFGSVGAYSSLVTGGDVEGAIISGNANLSQMMFAVPPGDVAVVEVAFGVNYYNDSGNIEADMETKDFQISCPGIMVTVLNPPPGR